MVRIIRLKHVPVLFCLFFAVLSISAPSDQVAPWKQKHTQLQQQRDDLFIQLENIHAALLLRVELEDPGLLKSLSLEPPQVRATGYGLLPPLTEDDSPVKVEPTQTVYSLKWLEGRLFAELQNASELLEQASGTTDLEDLVVRFEESLKRLRNLENNLSYHDKWQRAVIQYPAYYQKKNELIAMARELNSLIINDAPTLQIDGLRNKLLKKAAPFKPTPNLRITVTETGKMVLPVTVCTDIEDAYFLRTFQRGVDEAFSLSPAARARHFSVELHWQHISAGSLYPDGVPDRGTRIDMNAHYARFIDCPLVLTTGATSLNAGVGSRIFLGTQPVSPRTLAHEFGHLLGFEDAYLRGYDGDPADPYGLVIVEWTGLSSDLMGDSARGQVNKEMINELIGAYGQPVPVH